MTRSERKRAVGRLAAECVRDGMIVGLGTGSTAIHFVERLGERVQAGLRFVGIPTSERTAALARSLDVPLGTLEEHPCLDLAIDGADEVDPHGNLIKGLGGALLREKLVARAAREFIVIVDESKLVPVLGSKCPVPVEIQPHHCRQVQGALHSLGAPVEIRGGENDPYVTDNGNWILDAAFGGIPEPRELEWSLNEIPGVLENGLFTGLAHRVLVGTGDGVRDWVIDRDPPSRPKMAERRAPDS
jgi:ribose 5-phosphate isomerase A